MLAREYPDNQISDFVDSMHSHPRVRRGATLDELLLALGDGALVYFASAPILAGVCTGKTMGGREPEPGGVADAL